MTKNSSRRTRTNHLTTGPMFAKKDTRRHIAYLAAKLIAEEGVTNYADAKYKAAKSMGVTTKEALPSNDEIEVSLREHLAIFQSETQPAELYELRQVACQIMNDLADYSPRLVGSVLSGTANRFSTIEIDICVDDLKSWEIFLLNRDFAFKIVGNVSNDKRHESALIYQVECDAIPVAITVFHSSGYRAELRHNSFRTEAATLPQLRAMLQQQAKQIT